MFRAFQAVFLLVALTFGISAKGQHAIRCSLIRLDDNRIVISWEATPGRKYALEGKSSLHEPWQPASVYLATTNRLAASLPIAARVGFRSGCPHLSFDHHYTFFGIQFRGLRPRLPSASYTASRRSHFGSATGPVASLWPGGI